MQASTPSLDRIARRVTLRELRLLLAVARCGSILQAAQDVGLTQPAVSKAISDLEALLGARLFDRGNRGVEPTPQGRVVLARAAGMLEELRMAVDELAVLSGAAAGELRIGATPAMCGGLLPHVIGTLPQGTGPGSTRAGVRYQVAEMEAEKIAGGLRDRTLDCGVGRAPQADADLDFEPLFTDRLFVVAGAGHALARRRSVSAGEAARQRWLLPPAQSAVSRQVHAAFTQLGTHLEPPTINTMSILMRCELLDSGDYLTVLHGSLLRFGRVAERLRVLPIDLPAELPIGVLRMKNRTLTPLAERFIAHLRESSAKLNALSAAQLRRRRPAPA